MRELEGNARSYRPVVRAEAASAPTQSPEPFSRKAPPAYRPVVRQEAEAPESTPREPASAEVTYEVNAAAWPVSLNLDAGVGTPAETDTAVRSFWALLGRPWSHVWRWFFGIGLAVCVASGVGMAAGVVHHAMFSTAASALVPLSILILFWETDITRRVAWWEAALAVFVGGALTVAVAGYVNTTIGFRVAAFAGLTEEPIKGAAVLVLALFPKRWPGISSGVLLGACVGAGFAIFETVHYSYMHMAGGQPNASILLVRGALSPFMHLAWTGVLGGAMWSARGPGRSGWTVFASGTCWEVFGAMILFHVVWNSVGFVQLLAIALWAILFWYMKRGALQALAWGYRPRGGAK